MTKQQIAWASQHDWLLGDNGNGSVLCLEQWTQRCNGILTLKQKQVSFSDYKALREWAGY